MKRRHFLQLVGTGSAAAGVFPLISLTDIAKLHDSIEPFRLKTLSYIESVCMKDGPYGQYRYSANVTKPTLYSSSYAAMTRHLYRDLDSLTEHQRQEWINYLQSHQRDDGMFHDPVVDNGQYIADEHLSWHVTTALHCLGADALKPLRWINKYKDKRILKKWLDDLEWGFRVDYTSNTVQNLCVALQYARDFHEDEDAAGPVNQILDYLANRLDAKTGLWGGSAYDLNKETDLSHAIQAAYHFWLLWIYDGKMIPFPKLATDHLLRTQNKNGGYGCGVHNYKNPYRSSACEDIDSIDPMVRLMLSTGYRRDDITRSLERALPWVLSKQTENGSYVFLPGEEFEYGHPELYAAKGAGGMFATWFCTLTLAYLAKGLPGSVVGRYDWQFVKSPGSHFWCDVKLS
ncbi:MAG: hypothetical protein ABFS38_01540 [Bacteroidota bacterium]